MNRIKPNYKDSAIAHIPNIEAYQELYEESINNPEKFWAEQANRLTWFNKWESVKDVDYKSAHIKWFEGGEINACFNCVDRHIDSGDGDKVALIWEGNNPEDDKTFTAPKQEIWINHPELPKIVEEYIPQQESNPIPQTINIHPQENRQPIHVDDDGGVCVPHEIYQILINGGASAESIKEAYAKHAPLNVIIR